MTDERARELERRARASRDANDWNAYLGGLRLDDETVRGICYALLEENPDGAKRPTLDTLVRRGGIWLEQDEFQIYIHGAQHQGTDDETRQPYRLSWQKERSRWTIHEHLGQAPLIRFTYGEIPTLLEIGATVRAIEHARQVGRQPELTTRLSDIMREDITTGMLTSDRVLYKETAIKQLIRAYDRYDQDVREVNLRSGYGAPTEDMIQAFFGPQETRAAIDRRYNALLDIEHGSWSYFMRLPTAAEFDPPQTEPQETILLQIRSWGNEPQTTNVLAIVGVDPGREHRFRLLHADKLQ